MNTSGLDQDTERRLLQSRINFLELQVEELKARVDPEKDALIKERDMWAKSADEQRKEVGYLNDYIAFMESRVHPARMEEIRWLWNNPDANYSGPR